MFGLLASFYVGRASHGYDRANEQNSVEVR
jgi:hypothetical protein